MTARHPATPTAEPTTEQTAAFTAPNEPAQPSAKPPSEQAESTAEPPAKPSDWYADTLRAIVRRALDSDKPDIKGALAALAMLAEVAEPTAKQEYDVAHILRDARRRAIHGKQQTE